MEALVFIMVFARPAVSLSTFVMVFLGSLLEVTGGVVAQSPPGVAASVGVSPGAGLVMAYTGLVTAIGGLILGILQILAANRKADALTMIQLATMKAQSDAQAAENERLKKEVAENKGWIVTLLNQRHGEELGPGPTFDPDPQTATPQAVRAAQTIPDLLRSSGPVPTLKLPLEIPPALSPMVNPYGPLPPGQDGKAATDKIAGAVEDAAEELP